MHRPKKAVRQYLATQSISTQHHPVHPDKDLDNSPVNSQHTQCIHIHVHTCTAAGTTAEYIAHIAMHLLSSSRVQVALALPKSSSVMSSRRVMVCVAMSPFSLNSGSPTGLIHLNSSLDHSASWVLLEGSRTCVQVCMYVFVYVQPGKQRVQLSCTSTYILNQVETEKKIYQPDWSVVWGSDLSASEEGGVEAGE